MRHRRNAVLRREARGKRKPKAKGFTRHSLGEGGLNRLRGLPEAATNHLPKKGPSVIHPDSKTRDRRTLPCNSQSFRKA